MPPDDETKPVEKGKLARTRFYPSCCHKGLVSSSLALAGFIAIPAMGCSAWLWPKYPV